MLGLILIINCFRAIALEDEGNGTLRITSEIYCKDKNEMCQAPLFIYKGTWWSRLKYAFTVIYYYLYKSQEG